MTRRAVALLRAASALLLTAAVVLGAWATPRASSADLTISISGAHQATRPTPSLPSITLTVRAVSPPVMGPTSTLTVSGTLESTAGATVTDPTVRVVRPRGVTALTREDVEGWAADAGATPSILLARRSLDTPLAPGAILPFTLTMPTDGLRLTRPYGAVPIAVEVLDGDGGVLQSVHTFVGWSNPSAASAPPRVSVAWVAPLTLAADPALFASDPEARTAAWTAEVGPAGRLTRLLHCTATSKVAWALDPAVLGAPGRSDEQLVADPVSAVRAPFLADLSAGASGRTVLALPYADPDLAATADVVPDLVRPLVARSPDLSAVLPARDVPRIAWPADGELDDGRESAWRAAYQGRLDAVLASAEATTGPGLFTPGTAARGGLGTPVLRWDDALSTVAGSAGHAPSTTLSTQEFIAQSAALAAEQPSTNPTVLVALPRGIDADPTLFAQFLATVEHLPWVSTADVASALTPAAQPAPRIEPQPGVVTHEDAVLGPGLLSALQAQDGFLTTIGSTLADSGTFVGQWRDVIAQLTSTRWRGEAGGNGVLLEHVLAATGAVSQGLSITAQTTNFLADEGILRVTVVNDLDQTVDGIHLVLAPENARIRVVEPAPPVHIERHSKATVQVRLAAVAAGLVPVDAWLATADGTRLGAETQLTLRANPPGVWIYVAGAAIAVAVLLAGLIRGLRRPARRPPGADRVDVVAPTPEQRLTEPVTLPPDTTGHQR